MGQGDRPDDAVAGARRARMDKSDVEALYERYGYYLFKRCKQFLKNEEDAYDALHEVFLRCVRKAPRLDRSTQMLPWLNRVTTNYCLNVIRNRASRRTDARAGFDAVSDDSAELFAALCERHDLVVRLLADSPTRERAAAVAYFLDDLTLVEAAASLDVSVATVRRRLKKFIARGRRFVSRLRAETEHES
jgi:RNA polymerase sigma-70 factor (ECF subfamily)